MRRFDLAADLRQAALAGELDAVFGLDSTAIVQEFHPPAGGSIVRVEALAGEVLYAIRIENDPNQGFNLCPADICQVDIVAPSSTEFEFCPADAPAKRPLQITAVQPPPWVAEAVVQIFATAGTDVGGVEYLESSRDGQIYFYDINALSNFVTDAVRVVGFDPFARFVDFLERRAGLAKVVAVGTV